MSRGYSSTPLPNPTRPHGAGLPSVIYSTGTGGESERVSELALETAERSSRSYTFPIVAAIALMALGLLVWNAPQSTPSYYLQVSEAETLGAQGEHPQAKGGGKVERGSITRTGTTLRFTAVDQSGRMEVEYRGVVPDIFRDEVEVVVEGKVGEGGVLEAHILLAKCRSKLQFTTASSGRQ